MSNTSWNPLVHVRAIWTIKYFPLVRISLIEGDIIVHHHDDVVLRDPVTMEHLTAWVYIYTKAFLVWGAV